VKILSRPFGGTSVARAWAAGETAATALFPGDPASVDAYAAKADAADARFGTEDRARAAAALRGGGEGARERLAAFVERGGLMITTGQQPGLFGGPLYGLYKALTATALAARIGEALGRPILPVFWVASEDHGWDEVRTGHVVDMENRLEEVGLPELAAAGDRPLHRIPAGPEITEALSRFLSALPTTEFSARWAAVLQSAYRPERTLGDAFADVLGALTTANGLFFVQAHEPSLKTAAVPLLLREVRESAEREKALTERGRAISAAGFDLQVPVIEGATNVFLEGPEGRERLFRDGDSFRLRGSNRRLSFADVEARAEDDSSVLSPNVLLRPVVESFLLPTLCYVAGPGEAAYLPQASPVFVGHGIEQPLVHPRLSAVVLEGKIEKVLQKFHLEVADLARPRDELAGRLAREEIPEDLATALRDLRGGLEANAAALKEAVARIDPTLAGPVDTLRTQSLGQVADVERKVVQSLKKKSEVAFAQVAKAQLHLFPNGAPQERVFNPFYYVVRYDDLFLRELTALASKSVLP
jgi:bacillithiol biosynthesis cysteine-adding enzyme BshC